jgi:hypothetical protein
VDNLKKIWFGIPVKQNIITAIPYRPAKAQTPTRIRAFVCLSIPFSQFAKRLLTLVGGGMLYVKCTTCQTRCAKEQDINK